MYDVTVAFKADKAMEKLAHSIIGCSSFSGYGLGIRELGWECETEEEADDIATKLRLLGFRPQVTDQNTP